MSVYYVYQGETFDEERSGGYVWSPKLTKNGKKNAGYTMMTNVKKGDFILHNSNGKIMAVSIAKADCKDGKQPKELADANTTISWDNDGYRIDTEYYDMDVPLQVTNHKQWLSDHYKEGSAFTVKGTGKQQYMCSIDDEQAVYLMENAIKLQSDENTIKMLKAALADILDEKESEYDQLEKEEIDSLVDSISGDKPEWPGKKEKQAMTTSQSTGREKPKRDPKVAADALAHAEYKCEFDESDRVFLRKNGKGYTEPHHLIPISKYRDFKYSVDVMENIVSLCSHCHNLLHYGRLEDKKPVLQKLYNERIAALRNVGLDLTFEQLLNYYK